MNDVKKVAERSDAIIAAAAMFTGWDELPPLDGDNLAASSYIKGVVELLVSTFGSHREVYEVAGPKVWEEINVEFQRLGDRRKAYSIGQALRARRGHPRRGPLVIDGEELEKMLTEAALTGLTERSGD